MSFDKFKRLCRGAWKEKYNYLLLNRLKDNKSAPYLRLKNIHGTTIVKIWKKNFSKKLFLKFFSKKKYFLSRKMPENSKKAIQAHSTFSTNRKFQKNARGYPLINFKNFRKKSHSAEKNPKGGPLVSPVLLEALKNLWFSARIEPTHSGWVDDGR